MRRPEGVPAEKASRVGKVFHRLLSPLITGHVGLY